MSTWVKRLIICGLGLLAGVLAWPVMDLFIVHQGAFPSFLVFSLASGAVFGLIFGLVFGTGEGIIAGSNRRIIRGALWGALLGSAGGLLGFLLGQGVLFALGEHLLQTEEAVRRVGFPVARATGWAVLGVFVGAAEGVRAWSGRKVAVGVAGGLVGGIIGGAAIEYGQVLFPQTPVVQLVGLVLFGVMVSLFYSLVEQRLSLGVLRLLNGRFKGKEFVLNQRRILIGGTDSSDIILNGYRGVAERHAQVRLHNRELYIEPLDEQKPVYVNDDRVTSQMLKYEDVIRIGTAKLFFRHE